MTKPGAIRSHLCEGEEISKHQRLARLNSKSLPPKIETASLPPFRVSPLRPTLPRAGFSRTLSLMEVHFSPDVETRLQQLAVANGKDAEQLVKDTVARMLENQARFIAGVQKGIEQADRGELVEHKDVLNRVDRLFHS